MNIMTQMTAESSVSCHIDLWLKLRKALGMLDQIPGGVAVTLETADNGIELRYAYAINNLYICTDGDAGICPDDFEQEFLDAVGEIAEAAGLPYLEFSVGLVDGQPGGSGGYSFRIYPGGKIVWPRVIWPEDWTWVCPECGRRTYHDYEALVDVGDPVCNSPCDTDMVRIHPIKGSRVLAQNYYEAEAHHAPKPGQPV